MVDDEGQNFAYAFIRHAWIVLGASRPQVSATIVIVCGPVVKVLSQPLRSEAKLIDVNDPGSK